MPIIDQSKLPTEITSKYSIANNAFSLSKIKNAELDTYKNEPKDEINIFVGDDKVPDTFVPQLKLERWSNETNFSIRLVDDEVGIDTVKTKTDKIVWEKGNKKIEFYDFTEGEGGYKLVWFLKKKPKTNKVEFTIQSKGLDFFYQPELTPEEIAGGASRPPEVVGSYAVYHQTKGGTVDGNGKDYKSGKAFHIFRPHLFDANGAEAWGILHIENGIYSVEIPQDFLDTAVYPIKSNDTFGYTSIGATDQSGFIEYIITRVGNPGQNGTADSISAYIYINADQGTPGCQGAFYGSDGNLIATKTNTSLVDNTTGAWKTLTMNGTLNLTAQNYQISFGWDWPGLQNVHCFSDSGGTLGDSKYKSWSYNSWPATLAFTNTTIKFSIYATYTPSGGGGVNTPSTLSMLGVGM